MSNSEIMTELSIENLFPVYPEIDVSTREQYYQTPFNTVITYKDEFYRNKLDKFETRPFDFFNHQKMLANYMSSNTPYDGILLMHGTGTGKTSTAISIIEKIREENSSINGAVIFTKGKGLHNNFIIDLIARRPAVYKPSNYDMLNEEQKKKAIRKLVEEFYTFMTFEKFTNTLEDAIKNNLISKIYENFSNKVIVIDEVHNLRIQTGKKGQYDYMFEFLHNVKNCKVVLMSATPMKDNVSEIASVMNLILPLNKQLPTELEFETKFFKPNSNEFYDPNDEFVDKIKGRISYLTAMKSGVLIKYVTNPKVNINLNLKDIPTFNIHMNKFQLEVVKNAMKEEAKGGVEQSFSMRSREASLFVFPDKSYGKEGFSKYVIKKEISYGLQGTETEHVYEFEPNFIRYLTNGIKSDTNEDDKIKIIIENISVLSTKYAFVVQKLFNVIEHKNYLLYIVIQYMVLVLLCYLYY